MVSIRKIKMLERALMICSGVVIVFTIGVIVGIYTSSKNLEKLADENIKQQQTIQQQKERIRQLQLLKQYKEIYG
ncbi:hypothetical protein PNO24_01145 [Gemella haemolysans]|uniref:hypothetical protein n=1 Tax=Gemella haemolysans TaxID=1379 RepID=UPI00233123AC|nr:hypothetical protein [Gemella haemolysans]MDB6212534.1 hypothetical protein [Gemella haemolysans]